jgi:flagella basal body P-ring formation protein FlgA
MKTNFITIVVLNLNLLAQVYHNPENFKIGQIMEFYECIADSINPGPRGTNQFWDFSKLRKKSDEILTERIVKTSETPYKKEFKQAEFAEKNSDGTFVFFNKTENENQLLGFMDENSKLSIQYSDPMLFMKRPIKPGDSISDSFKRKYKINGMDMVGTGTIHVVADGTGTVILPNGKFDNVLRIKIEIIQLDAPVQYSSWPSKSIQKTWVWFDNRHSSALLKIDQTESPYFNEKSIKYLINEKTK